MRNEISYPRLKEWVNPIDSALNEYDYPNISEESVIKLIKFPEFRQTYTYDCGASSLLSVFCYYGIEIREEIILDKLKAKHTDIVNCGIHTKAINDYAKEKGLQSQIKKGLTPEDLCKILDENIPVILRLQAWREQKSPRNWEKDYIDCHYVVAIGYTKNSIIFEDPSSFTRTYLSFSELKKRWHSTDDEEKKDPQSVCIIIKGTPKYYPNKIVHMG